MASRSIPTSVVAVSSPPDLVPVPVPCCPAWVGAAVAAPAGFEDAVGAVNWESTVASTFLFTVIVEANFAPAARFTSHFATTLPSTTEAGAGLNVINPAL